MAGRIGESLVDLLYEIISDYTAGDLTRDMDSMIDDWVAAGRRPDPLMMAMQLQEKYRSALEGVVQKEQGFWVITSINGLTHKFRKRVNERSKPSRNHDGVRAAMQLLHPTMFNHPFTLEEHMQEAYVIEREGSRVFVPLMEMDKLEVAAKRDMLRRDGEACLAHADGLDRFIEWKWHSDDGDDRIIPVATFSPVAAGMFANA